MITNNFLENLEKYVPDFSLEKMKTLEKERRQMEAEIEVQNNIEIRNADVSMKIFFITMLVLLLVSIFGCTRESIKLEEEFLTKNERETQGFLCQGSLTNYLDLQIYKLSKISCSTEFGAKKVELSDRWIIGSDISIYKSDLDCNSNQSCVFKFYGNPILSGAIGMEVIKLKDDGELMMIAEANHYVNE